MVNEINRLIWSKVLSRLNSSITIKEGQRAMNREEGSYQLRHAYDGFLGTSVTYCAKNRMKKWF